MHCPRCKTTIGPLANPDGIVTCPGCGSRLMTRSAAIRSQGGPRATAAPAVTTAPSSGTTDEELPPPSATLPPTPAMLLGIPPRKTKAKAADGARASERVPPAKPADQPVSDGEPAQSPSGGAAAAPSIAAHAVRSVEQTLGLVLDELHALRALQERILRRLEEAAAAAPAAGDDLDDDPTLVSPIRARRQKTVVLIDDDPATRDAAVAELVQADVPVRAFTSGNEALSAIAQEKPDVIVLELGLAGEMAGKDVVNMIKSTMEWVEIPIVLWTREPVASQREARQLHGADELVAKSGGAAALVARVIALFRRAH
jgi:CheY-like chemotaxis protein